MYPEFSSIVFITDTEPFNFNFHEIAKLFEEKTTSVKKELINFLTPLLDYKKFQAPIDCKIYLNNEKDISWCKGDDYEIPANERFINSPRDLSSSYSQGNAPILAQLRELITDSILTARYNNVTKDEDGKTILGQPASLEALIYLDPLIIYHKKFCWESEILADMHGDYFLLTYLKARYLDPLVVDDKQFQDENTLLANKQKAQHLSKLLTQKGNIIRLFAHNISVQHCHIVLHIFGFLISQPDFKFEDHDCSYFFQRLPQLDLTQIQDEKTKVISELQLLQEKLSKHSSILAEKYIPKIKEMIKSLEGKYAVISDSQTPTITMSAPSRAQISTSDDSYQRSADVKEVSSDSSQTMHKSTSSNSFFSSILSIFTSDPPAPIQQSQNGLTKTSSDPSPVTTSISQPPTHAAPTQTIQALVSPRESLLSPPTLNVKSASITQPVASTSSISAASSDSQRSSGDKFLNWAAPLRVTGTTPTPSISTSSSSSSSSSTKPTPMPVSSSNSISQKAFSSSGEYQERKFFFNDGTVKSTTQDAKAFLLQKEDREAELPPIIVGSTKEFEQRLSSNITAGRSSAGFHHPLSTSATKPASKAEPASPWNPFSYI